MYFGFTYFCARYDLLYTMRERYQAGGLFWRVVRPLGHYQWGEIPPIPIQSSMDARTIVWVAAFVATGCFVFIKLPGSEYRLGCIDATIALNRLQTPASIVLIGSWKLDSRTHWIRLLRCRFSK
jgi:hypothetical protein